MDLLTDDTVTAADVVPWAALVGGACVGFMLTAGWMVRTAWTIMGDVQARHFIGLP